MRILKGIIRDKLFLLEVGVLSLEQYKSQLVTIKAIYQIGGK